MKRADLIRHIESHGCVFVREGANHTVYRNPANGQASTIPRHREIKKYLARKICNIWEYRVRPRSGFCLSVFVREGR